MLVSGTAIEPTWVFWRRGWFQALLLGLAVLLAYWPALNGDFVWDDDFWTLRLAKVFQHPGGLGLMWTNVATLHQYYPLTGASFWLDYQLWGFWTLPYHLENVLLHILGALLFWRLLQRLEIAGSGLAAAVFALHPFMVESVAWIAERKNVLSLALFLGALLAYARFMNFWGASPASGRWKAYGWALLLFPAAYLAKATTFAFPAVLLLLCWWKRGRWRWREDVAPTLPFFAVSIGLGLMTAWLERNHLGAQGPEWEMPLAERCLVAGRALWFYVGKLVWPAGLCFMYPRWELRGGSPANWLWGAAALAMLLWLWLLRRRIGRGPLAAALFYMGTLLPLLGFLNSYFMRYSFVSDHWSYLPSLGLIALSGAAISGWLPAPPLKRATLRAFSYVIPLVLGGLTWQRAGVFKNDETLWRDTLAKNLACWVALDYLGHYAQQKGEVREAVGYYRKSIESHPSFETFYNLGNLLALQGQREEAIAQFRNSIRVDPSVAVVHQDLGIVLAAQGRTEEAITQYRKAIELGPDRHYAHYCLASALERLHRTKEAIFEYRQALRLAPRLPEALRNLAAVLASDPDGQIRNGAEAVQLAEQACSLTRYQEHLSLSTLAIAYAEVGRFQEAVATTRKAMDLALAAGNKEAAAEYAEFAELFRSGRPYHGSLNLP